MRGVVFLNSFCFLFKGTVYLMPGRGEVGPNSRTKFELVRF